MQSQSSFFGKEEAWGWEKERRKQNKTGQQTETAKGERMEKNLFCMH
jgi:hypothetical protein